MYKKSEGFNILELLITIAIITLIGSIAFVRVTISREKARIAGALSFSQSIHQSFGATEDVRWTFETVVGNEVIDESGNGFNGTHYFDSDRSFLVVKVPTPPVITQGIIGNAISFDGNAHFVEYTLQPEEKWSGSFTVSFWVKADESLDQGGGEGTELAGVFASGGTQGTGSMFSPDTVDCESDEYTYDAIGVEIFQPPPPPEEPQSINHHIRLCVPGYDGEWHHHVITYNADSKTFKSFTDGTHRDTEFFQPELGEFFGSPETGENFVKYVIGANNQYSENRYFHGLIDEFNVYKTDLDVAQIQRLFSKGAEALERSKLAEN